MDSLAVVNLRSIAEVNYLLVIVGDWFATDGPGQNGGHAAEMKSPREGAVPPIQPLFDCFLDFNFFQQPSA